MPHVTIVQPRLSHFRYRVLARLNLISAAGFLRRKPPLEPDRRLREIPPQIILVARYLPPPCRWLDRTQSRRSYGDRRESRAPSAHFPSAAAPAAATSIKLSISKRWARILAIASRRVKKPPKKKDVIRIADATQTSLVRPARPRQQDADAGARTACHKPPFSAATVRLGLYTTEHDGTLVRSALTTLSILFCLAQYLSAPPGAVFLFAVE